MNNTNELMSVANKNHKLFSKNILNIWIMKIWLFNEPIFRIFNIAEDYSAINVSLQIIQPHGKSINSQL